MALNITKQPNPKSFSMQEICFWIESSYGGTPDNRPPDAYTVHINVYLKDDEAPTLCLSTCLDANQQVKTNLSKTLHPALMERLFNPATLPDLSAPHEPIVFETCCEYRIEYWETYIDEDGNAVEEDVETLENLQVCCAHIDDSCGTPDVYVSEGDGYAGFVADKSVLGLYQPQYAPWLNCTGSTVDVGILLRTYQKNGLLISLLVDTVIVEDGQAVVLPVGPQSVAPFVDPNELAYYEYSIFSSSGYLSSIKRVIVDHCKHQCERYFLYYNAFCLPQTIRACGETTVGLEVERKTALVPCDCNEGGAEQHEIVQVSQTHSDVFTWRTGYTNQQEAVSMRELFILNRVWQITRTGYHAVSLQDNSYNITQCCKFLHAMEFTGIRARKGGGLCDTTMIFNENPFYPTILEDPGF